MLVVFKFVVVTKKSPYFISVFVIIHGGNGWFYLSVVMF